MIRVATTTTSPAFLELASSPSNRPHEQITLANESPVQTSVPPSRATSPAASSVIALGSLSQRQPPASPESLPSLPKYPGTWDSLSSSSPENRKANSAYFTAAWGSPYATPSPRRLSLTLSHQPSLNLPSRDNSPSRGRGYTSVRGPGSFRTTSTSSQVPRPLPGSVGPSSTRDFSGTQGAFSFKQFTEDWIDQYLSGQPRTERTNWLSDDEGSEAPSFFTARNNFGDDPTEGWLGLDEPNDEDPLRTPTASNSLSSRSRKGFARGQLSRTRQKHLSTFSTATLRQEDVWGFAFGDEHPSAEMSDIADAPLPTAEHDSPAESSVEKPLPLPPTDDATNIENAESVATDANSRPPLLSQSSSQGGRAKVLWRKKTCVIAVPTDDKRGSEEFGYRLLTKEDVEKRLQRWQDEGYHVEGFDVFAPEQDSLSSQNGGFSRLPYPDETEPKQDKDSRKCAVRFPNLGEWAVYVQQLQEEKLRALGVFLDDDPPVTESPATSMVPMAPMGIFPGHITSPPIPTSSAASNPMFGSHTFSPHFNQSTNPSTHAESLASPPPQFGGQHSFYGMDANFVPGLPYPYQPTPPVAGTLTPQSLFSARQASFAGTGPGGMPNLNAIFSPVSPLNADDMFNQSTNGQRDRTDSIRDSSYRDSSANKRQVRESRAATLIMDESQFETEHFQASNVEIAHPTPRGHSHNLSETLQKGLDRYSQADYHLEHSIQRQLEEPESDLQKSRWAIAEDEAQPSPAHAQFSIPDSFSTGHHRLFGEQQQQPMGIIQDADEIDTNPSLAASPREPKLDMSHHPWHSAKPSSGSFVAGHKSKASLSGLNVEAQEFNPTAFAFQGGASFQSNGLGNGSVFSPTSSVFKPSGSIGNYNVAAPSFTPTSNDFSASSTSFVPSASKGFTFSTASFNVDAPAFNPGASVTSNASDAPSHHKGSIFGDIDFNQVSKPKKESKAIPIVRPDDEDFDGRKNEAVERGVPGTPPRQKRARRGAGEEDKAAEFAEPSPLAEATQAQATATANQSHKSAEGKENEAPEQDELEIPTKPASPNTKRPFVEDDAASVKDIAEDTNGKKTTPPVDTEPFPSVPDDEIVEPTNLAIDEKATKEMKEKDNAPSVSETAPQPISEQPKAELPKREPRKSLFSAFRSFTFRPSISEFVPTKSPTTKSPTETTSTTEPVKAQPEKPKSGLFASRYAVAEEDLKVTELASINHQSEKDAKKNDEIAPSGHDSPDEDELNAVMDQLNGDDSDVGVERLNTPLPPQLAVETPAARSMEQTQLPQIIRSDAPSPSPARNFNHLLRGAPKITSDLDVNQSQHSFPQRGFASGAQSPVRQLHSTNEHISDWDDVISSGEDEKLVQRSKFFDRHVNALVSEVLAERLGPLEQALSIIQNSVVSLHSQSTVRQSFNGRQADVEHSDADDEDDEVNNPRSISPLSKRDRRLEKMKGAVLEALAAHGFGRQEPNSSSANLDAIQETLVELKALTQQRQQPELPDIRGMVQEALAIHAQASARKTPLSEAEEIGAESLKLQLDGVKSMLRMADERTEQEIKARRDAQEALTEVQKMLGHAEGEVARYRQAAEQAEKAVRELQEEKIPQLEKAQTRCETLEKQQESWEMTFSELSTKNIALEGTLDEYRVSHDFWKKKVAAIEDENKDLQSTISHLTARVEDSMRARQSLRGKFDKLQDDMANVTKDVTRDQANARRKEEELTAKYESLRAAYDREVKLREKLEIDISELEKSERETAKLKFIFAQSQQENHRLEELVASLRQESQEHQNTAARFEREFNEARESSRMEIQRTRTSMEADLEAANNQVNYIRAGLEAEINRLEGQLENVRMDADTMKERYELLLEEARENKDSAMTELAAAKDMAMEEQRKTHDRVLNDLRERHARALHNASEDRQRIESYMNEKLGLSNEKVAHLQDRVAHLEEKLEIAKSAARAAAQAAQAKGVVVPPTAQHHSSPSLSYSRDSSVPEKISPQALRESILVLQDQLQQRESRIEELEQELSEVDKEAPNKIKERDTEISWLRELLGVRVDDLQDIIATLSQPSFDQNAVRDAAIRLRANLQMQQQEKDRAMSGQAFPSLADIAASPRSLPLAAAAAWGNWRKGRESFTSESGASQTPSKSTNGGFLSGLLTPPSSNVRYTPKNLSAPPGPARLAGRRTASESRPLRGYSQSSRSLSARQMDKLPVVHQEPIEPPTTPPLLRRSSYDHDAEQNSYDGSALMDDGESMIAADSPHGSRDGLFARDE
ncbi:myosin class II heavy chain (MHC), putative [Talaromyces stipitatus ATCC 10500]|uniref:Myosin class II heavy chain (MHC), putative n=1 Tax=Talaromyces stipitatus (strain ATCC 10500 / CBS 375.48 / QM 6759 / NRRL 1006) TaxID=441959 RepID=B8LVQ7_TALSN|nr:myosin class II heavy chain (MHC), putative [Talaromyces stipitatus ATCC 10500]EED24187.1 myosin class II heavy chain (MHC), putative [Talaromyces stipitatus ATCC 10500]